MEDLDLLEAVVEAITAQKFENSFTALQLDNNDKISKLRALEIEIMHNENIARAAIEAVKKYDMEMRKKQIKLKMEFKKRLESND